MELLHVGVEKFFCMISYILFIHIHTPFVLSISQVLYINIINIILVLS